MLNLHNSDGSNVIIKWEKTTNSIIYLIVNFLELTYLYLTWLKMSGKINNQLNIRDELKIATLSWSICSYIYIMFALIDDMSATKHTVFFFIPFVAILLRNISTFLATTFWTLWLVNKRNTSYYKDERINLKSNALNLEVLMTHSLPFNYFKNFIHEKKHSHIVYLNLYMLIELYRKKLHVLYMQSKMLRSRGLSSSKLSSS